MKPHDEHLLYLRDRLAWAEYVAPRRAKMLAEASPEDKHQLWNAFGPESRAALRALKAQSSE